MTWTIVHRLSNINNKLIIINWFAFQIGLRQVCFSAFSKTTDNSDVTQTTKHRYSHGTKGKGAPTEVFHPCETITAYKAGILEKVFTGSNIDIEVNEFNSLRIVFWNDSRHFGFPTRSLGHVMFSFAGNVQEAGWEAETSWIVSKHYSVKFIHFKAGIVSCAVDIHFVIFCKRYPIYTYTSKQ